MMMNEDALPLTFSRRIGALASCMGASEDERRVAQIAAAEISRATADGHVCIGLAELARRLNGPLASVRAALIASGIVTLADESESAVLPLVIDGDDRLYLSRYYDFERNLADALVRRARALDTDAFVRDADTLGATLERFFGEAPRHEVDWQRVAAALALTGRLAIVSGGPGTGKTTTVVGMLACLIDVAPQLRIALAAPTGKAAQRMHEALTARAAMLPAAVAARLPQTSYTLHRLLGSDGSGSFRHHRGNPLPYDVVVVDEASMIDVALAARLIDAVAPHARLILLGDKDQLAAVEAGAVFAELSAQPSISGSRGMLITQALGHSLDALCQPVAGNMPSRAPTSLAQGDLFTGFGQAGVSDVSPRIDSTMQDVAEGERANPAPGRPAPLPNCVVWLQRNYRFGLDSPIGRLSTAIREGEPSLALAILEEPGHDASVALVDDAGPALSALSLRRLATGFAEYARVLVETLRHSGEPGPLFDALNRFRVLCALRSGPRGADALNAWASAEVRHTTHRSVATGMQWFPGRPVIVTRNDYALGLFNGDTGIALPAHNGALRVAFESRAGTWRWVSPAVLPAHDTAFALTVHKSQGSEFDGVACVLPATPSRGLSRELVYTAITRARSRVTIIGPRDVLEQAIATPTRRDSGLGARLERAALHERSE
jgi:exodeoxyribonuclease V alpha subunit